jgi:hypothetical protein
MDEMYAEAMANEELGKRSDFPRGIVQTAKKIFKENGANKGYAQAG